MGKGNTTEVKSYQDLDVYKKAVLVSTEVGRLASKLPQDEQVELSSQMRRAADSVPSNITEGYGRFSRKEFVRFLQIANGSNCEVQTQIMLCVRRNFLSKEDVKKALSLTYDMGRMLKRLIEVLKEQELAESYFGEFMQKGK